MKTRNFMLILYQAMWRYSHGFRWQILIFTGMIGISAIWFQCAPYFLGRVFSGLQNLISQPDKDLAPIYTSLFWYAAAAIGSWLFHGPGRIIERNFAFLVKERCQNDLYDKVQALSLEWHQNHHSGNVTDRVRNAAAGLHDFIQNQFRLIQSIVNTVIPLVFLWFTAKVVAIICLVGGLTALCSIILLDRKLVPILEQKRDLGHILAALLVDYIANIQSIITLRLGSQTKRELAHKIHNQKSIYRSEAVWNETKWATMDIMMALMQVAVVAYLIYCFRQGTMRDIGLVVASLQYLQSFSGVFYGLTSQYEQFVRQGNDYKSSQLIFDAYAEQHKDTHNVSKNVSFNTLSIQDLSFAYGGQQMQGRVSDLNIDLRMGQKIAFVGASGSGKSTTMKLLRGLYPITKGMIALDGRTMPWSFLADMTTLIPQEPEIFENTIRYNITMGVTHDDAEILAACKIACFDTVLDQLPQGLNTDIREKGVNLSGGQKQRLALARGVFAAEDSTVILLDEPTSSIDGLTERDIYNNLLNRFTGKIIIASIHRLHLLNEFDSIYVFDQGRIAQAGTLDELLNQDGLFKNLWNAYQNTPERD